WGALLRGLWTEPRGDLELVQCGHVGLVGGGRGPVGALCRVAAALEASAVAAADSHESHARRLARSAGVDEHGPLRCVSLVGLLPRRDPGLLAASYRRRVRAPGARAVALLDVGECSTSGQDRAAPARAHWHGARHDGYGALHPPDAPLGLLGPRLTRTGGDGPRPRPDLGASHRQRHGPCRAT